MKGSSGLIDKKGRNMGGVITLVTYRELEARDDIFLGVLGVFLLYLDIGVFFSPFSIGGVV